MTATRQGPPVPAIVDAPCDTGGLRVTVSGDLDAFTVEHLTQRIGDLLRESAPTSIQLDLTGVASIDGAGASRLRRLHDLAGAAHCALSVVAATQVVWLLFRTLDLTSTFPAPARYRWGSEPGS